MIPPSQRPRTEAGARAAAASGQRTALPGWRARLRELYHGWSPRAVRFRYALLALDVVVIGFVIASSFFFGHPAVEVLDLVFGLVILAEFSAHLLASRAPLNELVHPVGIADLIVIGSFLARSRARTSVFCASCARCACSAPTTWSAVCGGISCSSGGTRMPCSAWSICWSSC